MQDDVERNPVPPSRSGIWRPYHNPKWITGTTCPMNTATGAHEWVLEIQAIEAGGTVIPATCRLCGKRGYMSVIMAGPIIERMED